MKKFIISLSLIFFSGLAFGQVEEEYKVKLKKMFEVSGSEESYNAVLDQLFTMYKSQYPNVKPELWDDLKQEFTSQSMNDLVDMLAPVYYKYLTKEDLDKLIEFYNTPVGKKFAKNTPLIMQESMQVGQQWGMKIGQEFKRKMDEKGY